MPRNWRKLRPLYSSGSVSLRERMRALQSATSELGNEGVPRPAFSLNLSTDVRRKQKEPHDGTHHAALKMASISYTRPSVASVGSSIADVIANPLSAW